MIDSRLSWTTHFGFRYWLKRSNNISNTRGGNRVAHLLISTVGLAVMTVSAAVYGDDGHSSEPYVLDVEPFRDLDVWDSVAGRIGCWGSWRGHVAAVVDGDCAPVTRNRHSSLMGLVAMMDMASPGRWLTSISDRAGDELLVCWSTGCGNWRFFEGSGGALQSRPTQDLVIGDNPWQAIDPDKNHDPCLLAGNPVSIETGDKIEHEVDFTSESAVSLLRFSRRYSSAEHREGSELGEQWRHTYSRRIDGLDSGSPQSIELVRHSGNRYAFNLQPDGSWRGDPDIRLSVRADTDGWTVTDTDGKVERYNASGNLTRIRTPAGASVSLDHDTEGRLMRAEDPGGGGLEFQYDDEGRITRMSSPDGTYYYAYAPNGELRSVTRPDGSTRNYHYDDARFSGALTGITDAHGVLIGSWGYDDDGRAVRSSGPDGADRTLLAYHEDGSTTVTNPLGKDTTYHFDTIHGVRRVTQVEGHPTPSCEGANRQYGYTDEGWLASATDWNGNTTDYEYNDRGLETARIEAVGADEERAVTTVWHAGFPLPVRIVEPGRVTEKTYDDRGRITSRTVTDPDTGEHRQWQYSYHPDNNGVQGQLARVTGPRADVDDTTHYDYDDAGNLTRLTNALGHVTRIIAHDAAGRPLRMLDPNGVITDFGYDTRGRLTRLSVDGATTSLAYDAVGNLVSIIRPNGSQLHFEFDPARRLNGISDTLGNRIDYSLDAAGNRTGERIRDGSGVLRFQREQLFDELGRLRQATGSRGQTQIYEYDPNDNLTAETDGNHNKTAHAFDALDRLIATTDALHGRTVYRYDEQDALTGVVDPRGNATRYTYNAFGDLIRLESPDSGITTFAHDKAGNRIRRTDASGQVTEYGYDALNRMTRIRYADDPGSTVRYDYDSANSAYGIGRLTAVHDAAGVTRYDHNAQGLVVSKTRQSPDGFEITVGYRYDEAGALTSTTYPGGAVVHYERGRGGLIRRVVLENRNRRKILAENIDYAPFGPLRGFSYGNGLPFSHQYDHDYRLKRLVSGPEYRHYTHDASGNIVAIEEQNTQSHSQDFNYDALHRLISAVGGYGKLKYEYDALGNRVRKHGPNGTQHYDIDPDSNRLLGLDGTRLELDANGNLRRQGDLVFAYDPENRLTEARRNGELVGTYTYNARHLRVSKRARPSHSMSDQATGSSRDRVRPDRAGPPDRAAGSAGNAANPTNFRMETTHFVYDQNGQLLAELDGRGRVTRKYIWLETMPLALLDRLPGRPRVAYYHTDHLKTPQSMTDANGNIVWNADYKPFGQANLPNETVGNNLRFPGQYYDIETGLHYNWHRYYDPSTGRYLSSDPIGLRGGLNTFLYALSTPTMLTDYQGLSPQCRSGWCSAFYKGYNTPRCLDCDPWETTLCVIHHGPGAGIDCIGCAVSRAPMPCIKCAVSQSQMSACISAACSYNYRNCRTEQCNADNE